MAKAIAVDLGGSSGRAMEVTLSGTNLTMKMIHRFPNRILQRADGLYWDVPYLMEEIEHGLSLVDFSEGESLSVDTWGVDYGLVDGKGFLSAPPHHYRDPRTNGKLAEVLTHVSPEELYHSSGVQFMEINTLFQVMCDGNVQDKTLLFMPDLILYLLSGVMSTECSSASTSGMLNAVTHGWNRQLFEELSLSLPKLLPVNPSGRVLGNWKKNKNAEVISSCGHDTQAAMVAVPAKEKDFLFLSSGTWSLLGTELDAPVLAEEARNFNLSNEVGYGGKTAFLKNLIGLWVIQELKREWDSDYETMDAMAREAKSFSCFLDLDDPLFVAPGPMEERIKRYAEKSGGPVPETRGEIVRSVYESLAMKYRMAKEQIERCTGKRYSKLYIVGGGGQSRILSEFSASAMNVTVIQGPVEATVLGNALVQFMTRGLVKDVREARTIVRNLEEIHVIEGDDPEAWNDAYGNYQEYTRSKERQNVVL
jgi:rhamnulokinase